MRPQGAMLHAAILCGMFTQHLTDTPGTDSQASRYGVGVMLRSQEIREALLSNEEVIRIREQHDEEFAEAKDSEESKLRSASRFVGHDDTVAPTVDLMEKILQVPKDEVIGGTQDPAGS